MNTIFTQKTVKALVIISFMLLSASIQAQNFWEKVDLPVSWVNDVAIDKQKTLYVSTDTGLYYRFANSNIWNFINHYTDLLFTGDDTVFVSFYDSIFCINTNENSLKPTGTARFLYYKMIKTSSHAIIAACAGAIHKSDDNGKTWDTVQVLDNWEYANSLIEDKKGWLYAGASDYRGVKGGVYRSTDGGNHWENIGLTGYGVVSLGLNQNDDVYAGTLYDYTATGWSGLYKYSVENNGWDTLWHSIVPVTSLVIDTNNIIYAGNNWNGSDTIGVRSSYNDGNTWQEINQGLEYPVEELYIGKDKYLYCISKLYHIGKMWGGLYRSVQPIYVGIVENNKNQIEIYPNPANEFVYIELGDSFLSENSIKINVYDLFGKKVYYQELVEQTMLTIPTQYWNNGMYIVSVKFANKIINKKITIIH